MTKAALLDANGVYLKMDELGSRQPTSRHLPQIVECDLPPHQYKWVPDKDNPYGGAFFPLKILSRMAEDRVAVQKSSIKLARRRRK